MQSRRRLDHRSQQLSKLKPLAMDNSFSRQLSRGHFAKTNYTNFGQWLTSTSGETVDPGQNNF